MSCEAKENNPYAGIRKELDVNGNKFAYYSLPDLGDERVEKLPYSIRVLLESALRNCDEFQIQKSDVEKILDWEKLNTAGVDVPFKPGRVILQDFTGVPAVVDLAGMRDGIARLGGDCEKINPLVPVDLVIDHSVTADVARSAEALAQNSKLEFSRNAERFTFLKWGSKAFENLTIVPPGNGIVHQVNLEYLARSVFDSGGVLYPDSLVGTDSHTTMINGLGICGWGVGGIEAESVMLGQPIVMVLPEVVGYKLSGDLPPHVTATDLVLTIVANLRKHGVVGKFVEFYGPGVAAIPLADRATIANMAPEYGATMGFFPSDHKTIEYLHQTGRDAGKCAVVEAYLKSNALFRTYGEGAPADPVFSSTLELDLSSVVPCVSGPKRPHDRVAVADMAADFASALTAKVGFKGFGIEEEKLATKAKFEYEGAEYEIGHGSLVIAAITSCTNTSNPSVMLGAAMVARNALAKGLKVAPYIKTTLSPGSGVVTRYLEESGLQASFDALGFNNAGYGCMTCIGNSGELMSPAIDEAIKEADIVAAAVLSGNRNFEGRVHPLTRANYLASPPLVVAYALAGRCDIDFETEAIGNDPEGNPVFLKDIWPTRDEISEVETSCVLPKMFGEVYASVANGTEAWNALPAPDGTKVRTYPWDEKSTYIHEPPFFNTMQMEPGEVKPIENARCILNFGGSITTDHISPAGRIARNSPAAKYLAERGVAEKDFNSYGSRRGNDEIMARGTFANVRLVNKLVEKAGPTTKHFPSGEEMAVFDCAARYISEGVDTVVLGGAEYGSGSSRDWAAKGPYLQGIKAVIVISYERIHRSNLVGMGLIPLQFKDGENADTLGLNGQELFSVMMPPAAEIKPGMDITVKAVAADGKETSFQTTLRFDTEPEVAYFLNGGILQYVLRSLAKSE